MCGVPHHALESYLGKMLRAGYKVAICDQVEDPKEAKGLVKRAVTRIVTPGTVSQPELLDGKEDNLLCAVAWEVLRQDRAGSRSFPRRLDRPLLRPPLEPPGRRHRGPARPGAAGDPRRDGRSPRGAPSVPGRRVAGPLPDAARRRSLRRPAQGAGTPARALRRVDPPRLRSRRRRARHRGRGHRAGLCPHDAVLRSRPHPEPGGTGRARPTWCSTPRRCPTWRSSAISGKAGARRRCCASSTARSAPAADACSRTGCGVRWPSRRRSPSATTRWRNSWAGRDARAGAGRLAGSRAIRNACCRGRSRRTVAARRRRPARRTCAGSPGILEEVSACRPTCWPSWRQVDPLDELTETLERPWWRSRPPSSTRAASSPTASTPSSTRLAGLARDSKKVILRHGGRGAREDRHHRR